MRILELNLMAFGPFTNKLIDLNSGHYGLHIIYGPNEAGKSSALRALHQMLYGIPVRSLDAFIHPYTKLRIGGVLQKKNLETLEFIRRKGNANTVRKGDDSGIIADSKLGEFLGNVDEGLFAAMFGIDHQGLVRGGEEIIRGGGNMGQVLFAAGAGISDFRKIQAQLMEEADDLFKPAARNPLINAGILDFNQVRKSMKDAQLNDQEWAAHDRALREAEKRKAVLDAELAQKTGERSRLERIQGALPDIALLRELQEKHKLYANAVVLPGDFREQRIKAFEDLKVAQAQEKQAFQYLEEIKHNLEKLDVSYEILNQADNINALFQELGSVVKAERDKLRLEGLRSSMRADAREILKGLNKDIDLKEAGVLRLERRKIVQVHELGAQYERLITLHQGINEVIEKLCFYIEGIKKKLDSFEVLPDTSGLEQALEKARLYGDIEAHYQIQADEIRRAENLMYSILKKLPAENKTPQELESLEIPCFETIDSFEDQLKTAWDNLQKLEHEKNNLEKALVDLDGEIRQLGLAGRVPSDDDLQKAREMRNSGWALVRDFLEEGRGFQEDGAEDFVKAFAPAASLPDAFELSLRYSDDLSDRMRREASQSARKAGLLAERETKIKHLDFVNQRFTAAQRENEKIKDLWSGLWTQAGIVPLSPREMRGWAQNHAAFASQFFDLNEKTARAEQVKDLINRSRSEIAGILGKLDNSVSWTDLSLSSLVSRGLKIIDKFEKMRVRRSQIYADLEQRENELREAVMKKQKIEHDIDLWREKWAAAVSPLGLDKDAAPSQANAVIEDCNALFAKLKEAGVLDKRISSIERDSLEFDAKVMQMVRLQAPDLDDIPPRQAAAELNARLSKALKAKTEQEGLNKQARQEEKNLGTARGIIAGVYARLNIMCEQAGCESFEGLAGAEDCSNQRRMIESGLLECESRLRKLSAGVLLNEFIVDAESIDPDTIAPLTAGLSTEIDSLNLEKSQIDQIIGTERNELSKMNGSARAAELEENAQEILARLGTNVEYYACFKLASVVLSQAIERYREKNQGPILMRSNELFSHMTLGSFEGLRLEFNEKNEAVIAGVRSKTKEIVFVDGMSDGTADQLYLAVRLATLESWLEKNEPMPFIIDDILIKFDDKRAAATLEILAELSKKTQVIFFTHHHHLLELAQEHIAQDLLFTRSL
ncbi:AAA ATPase-like domain-containing protein [Desulfonema limicola]|uniref:AAA ATPase-like domain-containing protein n=1 Tax=Desulfonema limicola TaxID=45656 RepID=A0A975B906_9BACT|nr:YhaN family protein [Desulfonema limicola]QTA80882.1 AAA ATPase-like domain-containing protein [Desulfonema limicola]